MQVRDFPREQTVRFGQKLLETLLNDYTTGRVFEYLRHIILGREALQ